VAVLVISVVTAGSAVATYGSGDGQFNEPYAVATDGAGDLYVADFGNNRIQKFNSDGAFLTKWGSAGTANGQFDNPQGIATDNAGNVYVSDTGNHRIQKFTADGTFLAKWGSAGTGNGQFNDPTGLATDASANVYVADYNNHRIEKFNSAGTFITKWGAFGTANGQFEKPVAIAINGANAYVADSGNERVQRFNLSGTFVSAWGSNGTNNGQFQYGPRGVATNAGGDVYVVDFRRIQRFTASGAFLLGWATLEPIYAPFVFGIAIDPAGNVYVADPAGHQILKFGPNGAPIAWPSATAPPAPKITKGPGHETAETDATFKFTGVSGGTYECAIDNGPWRPCSSGQTFKPFSPGDHLFQVRETVAGLTSPAASYRWTVDIPKKCVLRIARARVLVSSARPSVRLVIRYTSWRRARVAVSYKLAGSQGSLKLGSAGKRFKKKGVFRLPVRETNPRMAKVRAASSFTVRFHIAGTAPSCRGYYTKRLTIPQTISQQVVWFQSDSLFAP